MEDRDLPLKDGPIKEQLADMTELQLQQIVSQSNQWADYQKYSSLMDGIAHQMKEIPILPSEQVNKEDTNSLQKVEFPESGGVLTWMDGYEYPYRGYPHHTFVDKIDFIKKVNRAFLSGLYHQLKKYHKIRFLTLLPGAWLAKDALRAWVYIFYRHIDRFKVKTNKYSPAVAEMYRAFSQPTPKDDPEFRGQIRDLVCMILEFDNAYRFRAQDVLVEIDQQALHENPRKEIVRLVNLMMSREKTVEIRDTWRLLKYAIQMYLFLDPGLQRILASFLTELSTEKTSLTVEDKQYCIPRLDYRFAFIQHPSESDERLLRVHALNLQWKAERKRIQAESTKAHEAMTSPTPEDIRKLDDHHTSLLQLAKDKYLLEKKPLMNQPV